MRIYHKEAKSLASRYDVTVIGAESPGTAVGTVSVVQLPRPRSPRRRLLNALNILKEGIIGGARVIHFHDPELIWVGLLLKLFRKKVVYDVHEDLRAITQIRSWIPNRLKGVLGFLAHSVELIGQWFFDGVILAEDSYLNNFSQNDRLVVARNYVRIDDQPLNKNLASRKVFYAGSVTVARGVGDLIEAIATLQREERRIGAVIVGNLPASDFEAVTQLISALPNPDAVQLVSYTDFADLHLLASRCRIAVVPLRMARNYARSIPTKILDYMNWGMPFVYSRLELTDELFGHGSGGIGYTPGNVDELAGEIRCLLTDPALHQGLRREAREKVNKFAWESEEAALFRLYDDILSSGEA